MYHQTIRFLRLRDVKTRTGLGRSTIYLLIKRGEFPKSVNLTSGRSVGWLESDINSWIGDKLSSKKGGKNV